jgi:hypothetical protein
VRFTLPLRLAAVNESTIPEIESNCAFVKTIAKNRELTMALAGA